MIFTANYLIVATIFWFNHCLAKWDCNFKPNCYLRGPQPLVWVQAVNFCKKQGGVLTSINSMAEFSYLRKYCFNTYCWIGFTDEAVEGEWKWLDGSAVTFTQWTKGHPVPKTGADYARRGRDFMQAVQANHKYKPLCKKGVRTNQPTGVPTSSPTLQPTNSPTKCTAWTQEVALNNCPSKITSKTFGILACKQVYQKKLETSLANMFYGTCESVCVYDYNDLKKAFIYKKKKKCYVYVKRGLCFKKKKFGEAMRQILERQVKNAGC